MFQSTPSGGKATERLPAGDGVIDVSIHAFRGEGDFRRRAQNALAGVSIHAFRGEGDRGKRTGCAYLEKFQSTPSGGKATGALSFVIVIFSISFNPRLPGGRRPERNGRRREEEDVSIHAFRGEGDRDSAALIDHQALVSIHAFRGEGDRRGWRQQPQCFDVSIHAFRGEGDRAISFHPRGASGFNPRLPGGRRPFRPSQLPPPPGVSIHAFRGEGDPRWRADMGKTSTFQSTPSGGKATR